MAVPKDDTVFRLLCHLAWLRDIVGSGPKQSTLEWARRVYNSATHLQFRFVYPHQSQDRVAKSDQPLLAKAIEDVVNAASEAIKPLRSGAVGGDSALDAATARELRDSLNVLLDTAADSAELLEQKVALEAALKAAQAKKSEDAAAAGAYGLF